MREIKFRVWDKTEKRMVYNANVLSANEPDIQKLWEFMQYIGLKDKNGKEIYEGDIVYADYWSKAGYYCDSNFTVSFHKGCFWGFEVERSNNGTCLRHMENLEVIGNIYENPEFLGG